MQITDQNRDLWLQLYQAATALRDQQPWKWMYDSDLFAVVNPGSEERTYCSILGNAGEMFAVTCYFGVEGLASYDALFQAAESGDDVIEEGLDQKCLIVSFVDRQELTDPDLAQIKELGLKFRGSAQWVQFRRHDPGYIPWYLDDEQASKLLTVLRQALLIAEAVRADPRLIEDADGCLVRRAAAAAGQWETTHEPWPDLPEPATLPVDAEGVEKLLADLPRVEGALMLASTYLPGGVIEEEDLRPFFGRLAIWLHYPSGTILRNHVFHPKDFTGEFSDWFLASFRELEVLPQQIGVNSTRVYHLLLDLAAALQIELLLVPEEEVFDEVFTFIMQSMQGFGEEQSN